MAKNLVSREENFPQWYNDIVIKANLAENSAVRGCMVIKPYGYAIWEKMQAALDKMFKEIFSFLEISTTIFSDSFLFFVRSK